MGLKIIAKDKSGISFAAGATKLTFSPSENVKPIYYFAFDIQNNKLQEAFALMEKNVAILAFISPIRLQIFICCMLLVQGFFQPCMSVFKFANIGVTHYLFFFKASINSAKFTTPYVDE